MRNSLVIGTMVAGILAFTVSLARADAEYDKSIPAVTKALAGATLTLDQGIKAAAAQGKPLSAQYEIDEGHFQLSVFISKGDDLLEAIVDYKTGAIKTVQNLTDPDDIKDAHKQVRAMAKASVGLDQAVAQAVKDNAGYQAIQIIPKLNGDQAVATVVLVKEGDVKKVTEKLN